MNFIKSMDKKKKIIFFGSIVFVVAVITIFVLAIVNAVESTSIEGLTKQYMDKYQKLDSSVVDKIKYEFDDKLTSQQKEKYKAIMENQYEELEYSILEVTDDGTFGRVVVKFLVYDLASAMEQANSYIDVYGSKFEKDGEFDEYAAIDYKLDILDSTELKVEYTITFNYYNDNGKWVMDELIEADLKKINGTY